MRGISYLCRKTQDITNRATMEYGLEKLGHFVKIIDREDVLNIPIDTEDIFYGNVGYIQEVFKKFGYYYNPIGSVPKDLLHLADRSIEKTTVSDAILRSQKEPIFVKPIDINSKCFTGFVLGKKPLDVSNLVCYENLGHNEVYISSVITIVSEWRCFIHNKKVIDGKNYKGDFKIFPDYSVAEEAAQTWKNAPIAYSCDIGITDKGKSVLIECNDMPSLGLYGLDGILAAKMLEDRWVEIHKNKKFLEIEENVY